MLAHQFFLDCDRAISDKRRKYAEWGARAARYMPQVPVGLACVAGWLAGDMDGGQTCRPMGAGNCAQKGMAAPWPIKIHAQRRVIAPSSARPRLGAGPGPVAGPSTAGGLPWPGAGPCLSALSSMSQKRLETPPPRPKCEPDKIPPLVKKYRAPSQSTRASSWYFTVHIISTIGSQVGLGLWWLTTRTGLDIVLFPTRAFTIRHSPFILLPIVTPSHCRLPYRRGSPQ